MPPQERPNPVVPVLLAWLVPGAGHLRLGRVWPALFVALAFYPLFLGGMALAGFANVSPERHRWYFVLHTLGGLPTAAATVLTRDVQVREYPPHKTVGELATAVACLLNAIAVADVWARCRRGDPETLVDRNAVDPRSLVAADDDAPPPSAAEAGRG